jgi:hypothetical protein
MMVQCEILEATKRCDIGMQSEERMVAAKLNEAGVVSVNYAASPRKASPNPHV